MSIEIHCSKCQKLIKAPDDAGGRRGKCPYCKSSVYIPTVSSDDETIPMAPLDEDEERHARELHSEAAQYTAAVDHVRDAGPDEPAPGMDGDDTEPAGEVPELAEDVEAFVLAMRDSNLDDAEAAAARLKKVGTRGRDYVQGLIVDEMLPDFPDVPTPLVRGFLKALASRLEA